MAFTAEILSSNYSAIFASCLDSQLRLFRYAIAGLSPSRANATSLFAESGLANPYSR